MTYEEALAVATANNEIDENQTFLIDKNLRTVTIPDGFVLGVFNDKNVQIVPFAMPRYYNGIDMSTFAIQVNYVNSAGDGDIYLVFDQDVQEDLILFNWVVDRTAFATSGKTGFVVCMKEDDEYGYVAREFNTTLAYAPVLDGLEIDNPIDDQEVLDVLTQIRRAAERADIAAQQAEDSAAQASTDATTASNAATSASTSADTATAAQQSASASATSASTSEANALSYRNAAAASAAEAAAVVTDIEDVLTFPNALVVESASADDIVTIEDGADNIPMTSVLATMNPIQDLNGYDKPWPGGGGKNRLENTYTTQTVSGVTLTVNEDGTIVANGTASATITAILNSEISLAQGQYILSGCPAGGGASDHYKVDIVRNGESSRKIDTGSGTTFDVDADGLFTARVVIYSGEVCNNLTFEPMVRLSSVTDSTYAPYANICPITGLTGLTITASGRNLLPKNTTLTPTTSNGITFTYNEDGSITADGTSTAVAMSRAVSFRLPFGNYRKSDRAFVQYKDTSWRVVTGGTSTSDFMTIDEDLELVCRINISSGTTVNNVTYYPYIYAESETSTEYEPYTGTEIPITWESIAGTVYGGTLDVVSGVLTVKGVCHTLTGQESFSLATNSRRFQKAFSTIGWERANTLVSAQNQSNSRCSHAIYLTGATGTATPADYRISADPSLDYANAVVFYDTQSEFADAAAFNAYLAAQYANGTPVQLYYELATPLEPIQLTPTEVRTILGGNTIFTDAGDVSVEYRADLKMYIDKKIAEAIA